MECASLNLNEAATRAQTRPTIVVSWIRDGILPANWTRHGWIIRTKDLDNVAGAVLGRVA